MQKIGWQRPRLDRGETLIEVVVALTLLAIFLVPTLNLLIGQNDLSANVRNRATASYLATQLVESVRNQADSDLGASDGPAFWTNIASVLGASTPTTISVEESRVASVTFTTTETLQWVGQGETVAECSLAGSSPPQLLQVSANVTWPGPGRGGSVTQVSNLAPPPDVYSSTTTGNLGIQIQGAAGQPVSGVTVTAAETSGADQQTQVTGSDGCAFFAFLPTSSAWNVTASGAGDVSNQEQSPATVSAISLNDGVTTDETILLDQGATIAASLPAGATVAGGMTYSVENAGLATGETYSFPVPSGTTPPAGLASATPTNLSPLFPYQDGYVVFAGSCTDSDPVGEQGNGSGHSIYDTTAAATPVTAGGTTAVTLGLGTLSLDVTVAGVATSGAKVTATPVTPTNTTGWGSNIDWTCYANPTYNLSTSGTGGTSTTELPYGHYVVTATSGGQSASVDVWVALPWLNGATLEPAGVYALSSAGVPQVPAVSGPVTVAVP